MDVRRATAEDATALARVHVDSWRHAYAGLLPEERLASLDCERRAASFRKSIESGMEETYLAESEGELVGFLTVGACRDTDLDPDTTGEIWGIYLAPGHWRKGIGRYLCSYGESVLRSRGCNRAVLWVLEANDRARSFYEAMGFRLDGGVKELDLGRQLTVVRYGKPLGGD